MATIPSATVSISATAAALAGGTGYCVVIAPVGKNADVTPRVFASATDILAQHDYSPGADYAAHHLQKTNKPIVFVGVPIATPGVLSRQDATHWTGGSVVSVAAGTSGYLEEVDAILTVTTGGTRGTTGIKLSLSLDGGVTEKAINLGTATTYTIPYVGIVLSFGAGTMVAGDVFKFKTSAPMWDNTGLAAARAALARQEKLSRTWMVIGDVSNSTFAGYVSTQINAYETESRRFALARAQVRDRLPLASLSRRVVKMTGTPTITFAEVGVSGDTITRNDAGSFISDGFVNGMAITVAGSVSNNFVDAKITNVAASVLTLDTQDLVAEVAAPNVTITGTTGITFAEVGGTGDTITRSDGSWLDDGFAIGDNFTVAGSASNNITTTAGIANVTATVITLGTDDLVAEFVGAATITITKGETMAAYVSACDAAFSSVDGKKRLSLGLGRLRVESPITGWSFRRPVQWAASVREYQHDVHHPTWTKEDGPLDGWSLLDSDGNVAEYDEANDGGALAARFTCARTWGNGPNGAFIAMDLTRETEGSTLQLTHNLQVANVMCTVVQAKTENVVGKTPQLKSDGTGQATGAALQLIEESINTDVKQALMREFVPGEGPRASKAVWRASTTDDLRGPDATLTGVGELLVNGTVVHVNTLVAVS
jgi:hypothetical protein